MGSEVKIPTLLGLGILISGLVAGIFLVTTNQVLKSRAAQSATPKNITLANISSDHAAIFWQTDEETSGFIQAGLTGLELTFRDDRDIKAPTPHRLHFVTLANLQPATTYRYKVNSGAESYPKDGLLSFTTAPPISPSALPSLIGSVANSDFQPIDEAIVILEIPGAQALAAVTKTAGSFILPLAQIYDAQLGGSFAFPESSSSATLTAFDNNKKSQVLLSLPAASTLPPIVLGRDLDLTPQPASPSSSTSKYDLNNDGVVNSLDLSFVLKNLGKNPKDKRADLNGDGVVDQKDVDIINKYIPHIIPQ